jgi:hypothetical protein
MMIWFNYLILISWPSCGRVNDLIMPSYWAETRICVCRGIWRNLCLMNDCSVMDNNFAELYRNLFLENWYASNDQQVITGIGLSDCNLLFFNLHIPHEFIFVHPVDCTEVIRFRTLQHFRYAIVGDRHCRRRLPPDVDGATLQSPASAGFLFYRRPRRRLRRWLAPAAVGVGRCGTTQLNTPTLPPTRTSVAWFYNLRPLGSGLVLSDGCPVAPDILAIQKLCAAAFQSQFSRGLDRRISNFTVYISGIYQL